MRKTMKTLIPLARESHEGTQLMICLKTRKNLQRNANARLLQLIQKPKVVGKQREVLEALLDQLNPRNCLGKRRKMKIQMIQRKTWKILLRNLPFKKFTCPNKLEVKRVSRIVN